MLGDLNAKAGKEDIFKPTSGNKSLHDITNDNGVTIVYFPTSKNMTVKSISFHSVILINLLGHPLMEM
jgi:hypothetical protein